MSVLHILCLDGSSCPVSGKAHIWVQGFVTSCFCLVFDSSTLSLPRSLLSFSLASRAAGVGRREMFFRLDVGGKISFHRKTARFKNGKLRQHVSGGIVISVVCARRRALDIECGQIGLSDKITTFHLLFQPATNCQVWGTTRPSHQLGSIQKPPIELQLSTVHACTGAWDLLIFARNFESFGWDLFQGPERS